MTVVEHGVAQTLMSEIDDFGLFVLIRHCGFIPSALTTYTTRTWPPQRKLILAICQCGEEVDLTKW